MKAENLDTGNALSAELRKVRKQIEDLKKIQTGDSRYTRQIDFTLGSQTEVTLVESGSTFDVNSRDKDGCLRVESYKNMVGNLRDTFLMLYLARLEKYATDLQNEFDKL